MSDIKMCDRCECGHYDDSHDGDGCEICRCNCFRRETTALDEVCKPYYLADMVAQSHLSQSYTDRTYEYASKELASLRTRIEELEANIIEADAQYNIDNKPGDIQSAELALVRFASIGASAMTENMALQVRIEELEKELDEYKTLEAIKAIEAPIDDELNKEADDEHAKLVKLADEYFEYRRKHEWRPINSAPKDKKVLLRLHNGHIESGYWIEIFNMWSTEDLQPTLWMPLPEEI